MTRSSDQKTFIASSTGPVLAPVSALPFKPKQPKQVRKFPLTPEQSQKVKEDLKDEKSGYRYPKARFKKYGVNYPILKDKIDSSGNYDCYLVDNNGNEQFEIGKGAQGKIKLAFRLSDGKKFALKTIIKKVDADEEEFFLEYNNNVVFGRTPAIYFKRLKLSKKNQVKLEFLTEYAEGDNLFKLQKKGKINKQTTLKIVAAILRVYQEEILNRGYIHRDIKLENFMFDLATNDLKIIDLGFAVKCGQNEVFRDEGDPKGTEGYLAPELSRSCYYSIASDIYAFSILFQEILFNQILTDKIFVNSYGKYYKDSDLKILYHEDEARKLYSFLTKMRSRWEHTRPTYIEICAFFKEFLDKNQEKDKARGSDYSTQPQSPKRLAVSLPQQAQASSPVSVSPPPVPPPLYLLYQYHLHHPYLHLLPQYYQHHQLINLPPKKF